MSEHGEQAHSSKASNHSTRQEIPLFHSSLLSLLITRVCHCPVKSQMNLVHILTCQLFKIHVKLPQVVLSLQVPTTSLYMSLILRTSWNVALSNPPWFEHPNNIWWTVWIVKLLTVQFSQPLCYSSLFGPKSFWKPSRRKFKTDMEGNIKMDPKHIGFGNLDWTKLAHDLTHNRPWYSHYNKDVQS